MLDLTGWLIGLAVVAVCGVGALVVIGGMVLDVAGVSVVFGVAGRLAGARIRMDVGQVRFSRFR